MNSDTASINSDAASYRPTRVLCAVRYADITYAAASVRPCSTEIADAATRLRARYAMSGTDLAYDTHLLHDVRY
eukprot:3164422-Rhodomonas_salina.1